MEWHLCQPAEIGQGPSPAVKQFCWHFSMKGTEARSAKGARDSVPWVVLRFSSSDLSTSSVEKPRAVKQFFTLLLWTLGEEWCELTLWSSRWLEPSAASTCLARAREAKPDQPQKPPEGRAVHLIKAADSDWIHSGFSLSRVGKGAIHSCSKGRRESCFYKL